MAQDGNPLGSLAYPSPPTLNHQDQPLALDQQPHRSSEMGVEAGEESRGSSYFLKLQGLGLHRSGTLLSQSQLLLRGEPMSSLERSFHVCALRGVLLCG